MSAAFSAGDVVILTMSYRDDIALCRLCCESVDRFAPAEMRQVLYVPRRDLALFAPLASERRTVRCEDELLPPWLWRLPMPGPRLRRLLRLPRRNVYLSPFSRPVRGWIAQQMMKIAAAAGASAEIVVHLDSDTVFIRPLTIDLFAGADGRVRLYQTPDRPDFASHRTWHLAASRLLGLPPDPDHAGDYIDSVVIWRASVARALLQRLDAVGADDWRKTLARTPHFSEYILYGVFAQAVLGLDTAGLRAEPHSLCHSLWTGELASPEEEDAFVAALRPDQVACLLQSTTPLGLEARRRVIGRLLEQARRQDAAA